MKAIVLNEHGSTGNFSLVEMEKPKAIDGHVVIEVCASSLNPVDCKNQKWNVGRNRS